ncbi:FHA domain-containing protein [Pseudodonghicola xiamenensis]|nr:FHA domain-containing protein [Pseudodonghicola xiamenensis]
MAIPFTSLFRTVLIPVALTVTLSGGALAEQSAEGDRPALRSPASGLPIVDCDPAAPAPADSCILRVPPSMTRGTISREDVDGARGVFTLERSMAKLAPGVELSETLVLIDLSPGPGGGRKATWNTERQLIADFLRSLPTSERIALYGFNESLERLADFTRDRELIEKVVAGLELRGTNTRIATYARDAVGILGQDQTAILKNLIVITDGEEEGERDVSDVTAAAIEQGVTVSALGMLWRPVGDPVNGAGMDYLSLLSEGTQGIAQAVQLRRADMANDELQSFVAGIGNALKGSGLIVPEGTPVETDITVTLQRPVPGGGAAMEAETLRVRFVPAELRHQPAVQDSGAPQAWYAGLIDGTWLGIPKLWLLIGGGVILLLLALIVAVVMSRSSGSELEEQEGLGDDGDGEEPSLPAGTPPVSPQPALAYVLREDTGERLAVRSSRATLGRSASSDLVIGDDSVSRLHAEIREQSDGHFVLTDAGSLNGTKLNDKKLTAASPLRAGDVITLGAVKLRFSQA